MAHPIKLIVGLGNPGPQYAQTAHNAGFWLLDTIASHYGAQFSKTKPHKTVCQIPIAGYPCWLLKPMTFMNKSGQAVQELAHYYKIKPNEIVVAHDELDFPSGIARIKFGGGHGGHNGLRDINSLIGQDFYRLRIGVGHPGDARQVNNYLLTKASKTLIASVQVAISDIMSILEWLVAGEIDQASLHLHTANK